MNIIIFIEHTVTFVRERADCAREEGMLDPDALSCSHVHGIGRREGEEAELLTPEEKRRGRRG